MRKLLIAFRIMAGLFLTASLLPAFAGSLSASAISLKQNSVIEGNMITLGDVFSGLPRDADKVLGPAPRPGHDMVLNARTLLRIAVALDLPWRPASNTEHVVLSRAGSVVDNDMMKDALKTRIQEEGFGGKFNLFFTSEAPDMYLPPEMEANVEIVSFAMKPEKNRFEAVLAAPSKDNPVQSLKVAGMIERMTDVPVLASPLSQGDIIGVRDIHMIEMREAALKDDMIINADDLIGMTPRRIITAGQPVKAVDIESPRMVGRGDLITLVFESGTLQLTAQGKALEHGAKGDTIRVMNTSSNIMLQAEVTGSKEVTVKEF